MSFGSRRAAIPFTKIPNRGPLHICKLCVEWLPIDDCGSPKQQTAFHCHVHGGQQPVSNSLIQLYAVGASGNASTVTQLLSKPVYTDVDGDVDATGLYTCPSASTIVYIVSSGGNPRLASGGVDSSIALMAILGLCGDLNDDSFVFINEVTTVGAIWPLCFLHELQN